MEKSKKLKSYTTFQRMSDFIKAGRSVRDCDIRSIWYVDNVLFPNQFKLEKDYKL